MLLRIIRNSLFVIYLLLWTTLAVVHFLLLNQAWQLAWTESLADSLIFNLLFALFGVGFWMMAEVSVSQQRSVAELVFQHLTMSVVAVLLWLGAGFFLLQTVLPDHRAYLVFLEDSLTVRAFTGVMYYGLMVSFFHLLISYRQLRERKEQEALLSAQLREAELDLLRSQIRPHFLFNSLNSISALTVSDPERAHEMIIKLSDYMRYSLTFHGEAMSTLDKELSHIRLYLDIERVRFGEKLDVRIQRCETCGDWPVPAMILQPLIENAVKYGVYESTGTTSITIEAAGPSPLIVRVVNPFDPSMPPKKGTGTGLTNVRKRLETVYRQGGLMKVSPDQSNFTVQLSFPRHDENQSADH